MSEHVTAALRVVQVVAGRPDPTDPMTVGAIARELKMGLSKTSRLCAELEAFDLLERGGQHGTYRIGPGAIGLSGRAAAPFAQSVRFAMTLAAQQTGETALLATRSAAEMRVVAAVESIWTMHAPAEVGELIENGESAVLRAADRADAEHAQKRVVESVIGMSREIATPILGPTGECVAILAVRLPINRSGENGPRARRAVVAASRSIERALEEWLNAPPRTSAPVAASSGQPRALEAALGILRHLASGQDTVAGTARAVGLRPDRAQRLIASCQRAGFLLAGSDRTRFQLAWMVHGWHRAAAAPILASRARQFVAASANSTLTCGFITTLKGMRSFTIVEELEKVGEGLGMLSWLGRAHPIVGSDGGPTLLMDFSEEELRLIFPSRHTTQELEVFVERVRRVVRDRVLFMEAFEDSGVLSISAPVRDASGLVVAAACLVGTVGYMNAHLREFTDATRALAVEVSDLLGYDAALARSPR